MQYFILSWLVSCEATPLPELPELSPEDEPLSFAKNAALPPLPVWEYPECPFGGIKCAEFIIFCPAFDTASPPAAISWEVN